MSGTWAELRTFGTGDGCRGPSGRVRNPCRRPSTAHRVPAEGTGAPRPPATTRAPEPCGAARRARPATRRRGPARRRPPSAAATTAPPRPAAGTRRRPVRRRRGRGRRGRSWRAGGHGASASRGAARAPWPGRAPTRARRTRACSPAWVTSVTAPIPGSDRSRAAEQPPGDEHRREPGAVGPRRRRTAGRETVRGGGQQDAHRGEHRGAQTPYRRRSAHRAGILPRPDTGTMRRVTRPRLSPVYLPTGRPWAWSRPGASSAPPHHFFSASRPLLQRRPAPSSPSGV